MKPINTFLALIFISLLSSPSWSMTLGNLVERDVLYYEKFTNVPFNGKVTGKEQWSFKNGVEDGTWVDYYENGQLMYKGTYTNVKYEGAWVGYNEDGTVWERFSGTFKDGVKISD